MLLNVSPKKFHIGYDQRGLHHHQAGFLGAAISLGQGKTGVSKAPDLLRQRMVLELLSDHGFKVDDYGDVLGVKKASPSQVGSIFKNLFEQCKKMAIEKEFSVVVGGDHSIAMSTIAGQLERYPDLGVVWVDAHGDINTPSSSPTGNLHGMPVAMLLGLVGKNEIPGFDWYKGRLRPEKIVYVGVRDLDVGERRIINELGIAMFTAEDVEEQGIRQVMAKALKCIDPQGVSPLHLSFDIDAVDPEVAPATGLHVPGGISKQDVHDLGEHMARTGRLVSVDLVELNPEEASDKIGLDRSVFILLDLLNTLLSKDSFSYDYPV